MEYAGKTTDVRVIRLIAELIDRAAREGHGGYPDESLLKIVHKLEEWLEENDG